MLGADQIQVVGYAGPSGWYCRKCAEDMEQSDGVNIHGAHWQDIIAYSADELASEQAFFRHEGEPDSPEEVQDYDYPTCENCGGPIGA